MAVQTFTTVLKNMEVRKVDKIQLEIGEKVYESLDVKFDDEDGERLIFKDKNVGNFDKYVRGQVGDLSLQISTDNIIKEGKAGYTYISEKTVMTIKDFKVKK